MFSLSARVTLSLSVFALLFPAIAFVGADPSPLAGSWGINAGKSQAGDSKLTSLTIQQAGANWKIESTAHKGDADVKTEFTCTTNGKDCEFGEAGHKAKVSMWYNGPALMILVTEGTAGDVVWQWKLEADGKALTLTLSHIVPAGSDETMAFDKAPGGH